MLSLYIDFDRSMAGTLDGLEGESWVTAEGHPIAFEGTRESLFLPAMLLRSCSHAQRLPSDLSSPQDTPLCCASCLLPSLLLSVLPHNFASVGTTLFSTHTWLFIEPFFPFSALSRDNYACQVHMQR